MEPAHIRLYWTSAFAGVLFLLTSASASARATELPAISAAAAEFHGGSTDTGQIYTQCLLSTVRYDVSFETDQTTYVITGDIGAMWLRDASAQVRPYLFFVADPEVRSMLRGVIAREAKNMLADPYANAFNRDYKVAEEKYELDSLLYPIQLAWMYWKQTHDSSVFTPEVKAAYERALGLMQLERDHTFSTYRHRELINDGKGAPTAVTGMVWTAFRPSDDPATYGYNIPEEMFAAVGLGELKEIEADVWHDNLKRDEVEALRAGIVDGINRYGIVYTPKFGYIYAYEVDGLGHSVLMDDANVPSLLSIPYMGFEPASNGIYQNTRRFVLSSDDPYYFTGKYARGVGSPHTQHGYVWPLALVMQGLTAADPEEVSNVLAELQASDTGDHLLHESFDPNNPSQFTRSNFGWPCSLYSELVLDRVMGFTPLPTPTL
ncbi:MAG TPA: glycoside hydrolase family 125 protein [Candidatus Eremiobacteraceae bacterium]|nr:glycoside hydrolase family 125 protein [Candidatus Eremiobacteraceae bacterium]